MTDGAKPILISSDTKQKQKEIDRMTDPSKAIQLNAEQMMSMAHMAFDRHQEFLASIPPKMTKERALRIRQIRANNSWRIVAGATAMEWGMDADWFPPNNQLAGMALCTIAAKFLGEDENKEPWA